VDTDRQFGKFSGGVLLEFLSDDSVHGILIILGVVILLFGAYLLMVYLSNQSIRKLAERTRVQASTPTRGRLFTQARWVIAIMLALIGGLFGLLLYISSVSR
jgi:uncharacterized membrane protein